MDRKQSNSSVSLARPHLCQSKRIELVAPLALRGAHQASVPEAARHGLRVKPLAPLAQRPRVAEPVAFGRLRGNVERLQSNCVLQRTVRTKPYRRTITPSAARPLNTALGAYESPR